MKADVVLVKMAEIAVGGGSSLLKTTLGSCVAVVLYDPRKKIGGMAHIMLPKRLPNDATVGKYADTAIAELLQRLLAGGCSRSNIRAVISGGANMFPQSGDRRVATIGEKNLAAVKRILNEMEIPIIHEDTGGEHGRALLFDNRSGELQIRTLDRMLRKRAAG
jgi:chemotaxis protein CheD